MRMVLQIVLLLNTWVAHAQTLANQGEELLYDGKLNPTCAWLWTGTNIDVVTEFPAEREVGGVRFTSGRSWVNCCVKRASFFADGKPVKEHVEFRPANTFKELYTTWPAVKCRSMTMRIEDTYDFKGNYYSFYTHQATPHLPKIFDAPAYPEFSGARPTVQIAEFSYFGAQVPDDLPLPNANGDIAFPVSRLLRDWMFQACAVSNISHCANVEPDTTKPDSLGQDISTLTTNATFVAEHWQARREFLSSLPVRDFIYVKHLVMGNSIMHATDDLTDASYLEWKSVPDYFAGAQLIKAHINDDGTVSQEVLLDEPMGIIRDPALSFDAACIVFAKRTSLTKDDYHLWQLDLQTRKLTQLTHNEKLPTGEELICSDIEPCWLPDGSLLFQSTRCCHSVDCWPLPVSNLYRCDADGKHIRRLGFDQVQTFYPQLMNDGRVSFTRWEYNDRNASGAQQLYAMNPDGTRQTGLFANNSEFPFSLMHARAMPNSSLLVALMCGHHVAQKGRLVELDMAGEDDYTNSTYEPSQAVWGINTNAVVKHFPGKTMTLPWTQFDNACGPATTNMPAMYYLAGAAMNCVPGRTCVRMPRYFQYNAYDMHTQFGPQWTYPYPLSTNQFLVSFMPEGCRYYRGPYSSRFGIYAMDSNGRRELLAFDWGNHCMQPVPLMARPRPNRVMTRHDYRNGFAQLYVQNVYHGLPMKGVNKGEVKKLRVVALEYRPVHIGWNWQYGWHSTEGKIGTPIAVGNAAYDVKHVLGEVDVKEDGSVYFEIPARTPVYFQLLDSEGLVVQTMRSWVTMQPGEFNGCMGCHERVGDSPSTRMASGSVANTELQRLRSPLTSSGMHPFMEALYKEGPLASLDNWMGVNRPKQVDANERGDGFSFDHYIQPILNAKCVRCHDAKHRVPLVSENGELPPSDDKSHRNYSKAYLALSDKGKCSENINFANGMGFVPFKPARTFGAVRSKWYWMLRKGHSNVKLTDDELRTFAMWIDLCVPFCGSYVERNNWCAWHVQRFEYTNNKRSAFHWLELNDVRAEYGLPPLPLTGFKPGVTEPSKQKRWFD